MLQEPFFVLDVSLCMGYNMLNKEADTIADTYPFPAKIVVKNSTLTLRERGCYFLWLTYSKMATIRIAKVSSTINSSYVLISLILSARLGTDNEPPVGCLGSILYCHGSLRGSPLRHIAVAVGNPDTFLSSYAFKGSSMRGQAGYWDWLPNLGESKIGHGGCP